MEQIYKSIDKGKISLIVLLDLSKAFNSVNHDLLLNKLFQLNTDNTWFASYLQDITHSVKIDKIMSKAKYNLYGVVEYPKDQYLVQSSLTFFSMTFPKLIHYRNYN